MDVELWLQYYTFWFSGGLSAITNRLKNYNGSQIQQKFISFSDFKVGIADSFFSSIIELHHLLDMASQIIISVCVRPVERETKDEESACLKLHGTEMVRLPATHIPLVRMSHLVSLRC